jgi:hypothetical protein
VDLSQLSRTDKAIGGASLLFLISLMLPWYGIGGYSEQGVDYFVAGIIPLLLFVSVVGLLVLDEATDVDLPVIPVSWSVVYVGFSGLGTLLVLFKLLLAPSISQVIALEETLTVDLGRRFGLFVAVLAAAGVTAAAVVKLQDEGGLSQLAGKPGKDPYPPNPPGT